MFGQGDPLEFTPAEFEQQVHDWIKKSGKGLKNFAVQRLQLVAGDSGEYEIDVLAEFIAFRGALFRVLVECKRYTHRVKRDVVLALDSKIRDTGAHKGMIFSTSGFQKGAIRYAQKRGIATIEICDGKSNYITASYGKRPATLPPWVKVSRFIGWFTTLNDEGHQSASLLDDDRTEPLDEWFKTAISES